MNEEHQVQLKSVTERNIASEISQYHTRSGMRVETLKVIPIKGSTSIRIEAGVITPEEWKARELQEDAKALTTSPAPPVKTKPNRPTHVSIPIDQAKSLIGRLDKIISPSVEFNEEHLEMALMALRSIKTNARAAKTIMENVIDNKEH